MTIKLDNPSPFEKELFEFLKKQKQELEELSIDTLKNFISSFQKKQKINYKNRKGKNIKIKGTKNAYKTPILSSLYHNFPRCSRKVLS